MENSDDDFEKTPPGKAGRKSTTPPKNKKRARSSSSASNSASEPRIELATKKQRVLSLSEKPTKTKESSDEIVVGVDSSLPDESDEGSEIEVDWTPEPQQAQNIPDTPDSLELAEQKVATAKFGTNVNAVATAVATRRIFIDLVDGDDDSENENVSVQQVANFVGEKPNPENAAMVGERLAANHPKGLSLEDLAGLHAPVPQEKLTVKRILLGCLERVGNDAKLSLPNAWQAVSTELAGINARQFAWPEGFQKALEEPGILQTIGSGCATGAILLDWWSMVVKYGTQYNVLGEDKPFYYLQLLVEAALEQKTDLEKLLRDLVKVVLGETSVRALERRKMRTFCLALANAFATPLTNDETLVPRLFRVLCEFIRPADWSLPDVVELLSDTCLTAAQALNSDRAKKLVGLALDFLKLQWPDRELAAVYTLIRPVCAEFARNAEKHFRELYEFLLSRLVPAELDKRRVAAWFLELASSQEARVSAQTIDVLRQHSSDPDSLLEQTLQALDKALTKPAQLKKALIAAQFKTACEGAITSKDYRDLLLKALRSQFESVVIDVLRYGARHGAIWRNVAVTLQDFTVIVYITRLEESWWDNIDSRVLPRQEELCRALGRCMEAGVDLDWNFLAFVSGDLAALEMFWPPPASYANVQPNDPEKRQLQQRAQRAKEHFEAADNLPVLLNDEGRVPTEPAQSSSFREMFWKWAGWMNPENIPAVFGFVKGNKCSLGEVDHDILDKIVLRWQNKLSREKELNAGNNPPSRKKKQRDAFIKTMEDEVKAIQAEPRQLGEEDRISRAITLTIDSAKQWLLNSLQLANAFRGSAVVVEPFFGSAYGSEVVLFYFSSLQHCIDSTKVTRVKDAVAVQRQLGEVVEIKGSFNIPMRNAIHAPMLVIRDLEFPVWLQGGKGQRWLSTLEQEVILTGTCESIMANHVHAPFFFSSDTRYGWTDYEVVDKEKLYHHYPIRIQGPPYSPDPTGLITHRVWTTPLVRLRFGLLTKDPVVLSKTVTGGDIGLDKMASVNVVSSKLEVPVQFIVVAARIPVDLLL